MARHSTDWTAPTDPADDSIWVAGLLAILVVMLWGVIALTVALLFNMGPAAGLVGSAAGSLLCWECTVWAMAFITDIEGAGN